MVELSREDVTDLDWTPAGDGGTLRVWRGASEENVVVEDVDDLPVWIQNYGREQSWRNFE